MPLYEYRCAACDQIVERRHGYGEPAGACPSCGAARLERQLPRVAVLVKGSRSSAEAADPEACTPYGCAKPGCAAAASRLN